MNFSVLSALLPVILLIGVGYFAGYRRWIGADSVRDLSNLVFLILMPAMLFRSMSGVHLQSLDLKPVGLYFLSVLVLFAGVLFARGLSTRTTVIALAAIFSNTVMLGLPISRLVFGEAGFVIMVTLVSLHALVLLTVVTVVLEIAVLREQAALNAGANAERTAGNMATAAAPRGMAMTVLMAVRNAVIHPVPLPIIVGLLFAQTGLVLPEVIDRPLQLLGMAFSPVALLVVGITLAHTKVGNYARPALKLSVLKNLLHPVLMTVIGWLFGLRGLSLAVMVTAASMPIGANVFLFSQRYKVAEPLVIAAVAVSTAVALVTIPVVMSLLALLPLG